MPDDIEPLEPTMWFSQIEKLLDRARRLEEDQPNALLRQALQLARLVPRPLRDTVGTTADDATLEQMLDSNAFTSAAIAIMPPPMAFTLKQRRPDGYLAYVSCSNSQCCGRGKSRSAATALLIGWCSFLLALRKEALLFTGPTQHILRSEQRQRPIEH